MTFMDMDRELVNGRMEEYMQVMLNRSLIYNLDSGNVYNNKGQWVNNKMEGKGVFTWPDERKYVGHFS
jgi:hypothetical protein